MNAWESLQNHTDRPWLGRIPPRQILSLATQYQRSLNHLPTGSTILLAERDPVKFLAFWVAAAAHRLILANPDWQQAEWQQVADLVQPDLSVGTVPPLIPASPSPPAIAQLPCPAILIPTGGSSGHLKFAIHTWETLSAAVQGLQDFLQLDRINSCCVLPLYHVSGLMQAIRCLITGGTIVIHPWQNFKAGILPPIEPSDFLLSLVPTQLSQLFDTAATQPQILDFLQSMPAIFLGGAPAWPSLLDRARQHALPLAPTYGMTETAGQIATLKPAEFLAGKTGCGKPLSHAQITIVASQAKAAPAIGKLQIQARSQMLGYFPSRPSNDWENAQTQGFCPDDLGYFDAAGDLHILGRNSDKIISGGENIFPAEVEAAIRATGLIADVCVIGLPDDRWGEIVAAVIVATVPQFPDQPLIQQLQIALTGHLSQYKHPRRWLVLDQLPRNAQGKLTKTTIQSWLKRTVAEG